MSEVEAAAVVEKLAAVSDALDAAEATITSARKRLGAACEAINARERARITRLEDGLASDRNAE